MTKSTLTPDSSTTLDCRMPAEWEPHEATWLAWPTDRKTWPDELPELEKTYLKIIEVLHVGESVRVLVDDDASEERITGLLKDRGIKRNVAFHQVQTRSNWIRDFGPMFLAEGERSSRNSRNALRTRDRKGNARTVYCDWRFNAWGGKSKVEEEDNVIPKRLESILGMKRIGLEMVLEGGSIDVNGAGVVLTTEQCLLNANRNPNLDREKITETLKNVLGVHCVIWACEGIVGDDTDGHVDTVARFVNRDTVVACLEADSSDGNFSALRKNWKRLEAAAEDAAIQLKLIALPMPGKIKYGASRFPASYANFYIANKSVLVPTYGHSNDNVALSLFTDLFPKRQVVGIPGVPLIYGRGGVHCATLSQPMPAPA